MKICMIDYGMGNIASVTNAIKYLNKKVDFISRPEEVLEYDTIILPGVGAFSKAMDILQTSELDKAIVESVSKGKRIIGICLGMQLLFSKSHEFGLTEGLNLIEGEVLPFEPMRNLQIPHMGWNNAVSEHKNYDKLSGDYYFVHSFYCVPDKQDDILFRTKHGIEFCSGINVRNQIIGLQFHPEKSQKLGLQLFEKIFQ